jgi:hypothetical protein
MHTNELATRLGRSLRLGALACVGVLAWTQGLIAAEPSNSTDHQPQEQVVLLAAKVKKMAEIQDLLVQQHQLVLEHLDALRKDVDRLVRERTNTASRTEATACLARLERLQAEVQSAQSTNWQHVCALMREVVDQAMTAKAVALAPNGAVPRPDVRLEPPLPDPRFAQAYKVQPGDTLLKILARANEALEKVSRPRLTQEDLEKANPGLTPDKIKVGQIILIPTGS